MVKAVRLNEFLERLNVPAARMPPLVHSTSAHRLFDVLEQGKLLALPCNVFQGDKLCYCFVGRPAYKGQASESPSEWQLPMAFVIRFQAPPPFKRVFPFDSGAFRGRRLPSYITVFKLDGYDISGDSDNVGRLISFFFKSSERYVRRRAAGDEELKEDHNLDMRHQEILALGRLFRENSTVQCDDRAAAIEVQIESDIKLNREDILGVVVPEEFKRTQGVMTALKAITSRVQTYPHMPLGTDHHYAYIYEAVEKIYKKAGVPI